MANALATVTAIDYDTNTSKFVLFIRVAFGGSDVPNGGDIVEIPVEIIPTDSATVIKTKVAAGLTAAATDRGFTVAANNMLLPAFQKG